MYEDPAIWYGGKQWLQKTLHPKRISIEWCAKRYWKVTIPVQDSCLEEIAKGEADHGQFHKSFQFYRDLWVISLSIKSPSPWMHTSYKQKARRQITAQGKMGSRGDQLFVICVCPHSLTKHNSSFLRVQTIKVLQTCTLAASNKIQGNKNWPVS